MNQLMKTQLISKQYRFGIVKRKKPEYEYEKYIIKGLFMNPAISELKLFKAIANG